MRLALLAWGIPWDGADDLVQEVWLRLVRQQRAGRLQPPLRLPGLAITQAGWLALEARRTQARHGNIVHMVRVADPELERIADLSVDSDPVAIALQHERVQLVRRALAECPQRARDVVSAAYGHDTRAHADVARDLGLSVQRVRQILCETRARVRSTLARWKSEDDA